MADLEVEARRVAENLRNIQKLLEDSGKMVAREIKDNIDKRQNAPGGFPVPLKGALPGEVFKPLSEYTLKDRERRGVSSEAPLKDSGRLYREIGVRRGGALSVRAGGTTARARRLLHVHFGTVNTGIKSSALQRDIPPRVPVGVSQKTRDRIAELWKAALDVTASKAAFTVNFPT